MHLCEIIYPKETGSQRLHDLFLSFAGNVPDKTNRQTAEMQNESGFSDPAGSYVYRNKEQIRITDPGGVACLQKYRANQVYRPRRGRISIEIQSEPGLPARPGTSVSHC